MPYLVLRRVRSKWLLPARQLFDDDAQAWDWVDRRFKTDEERLQFYLMEVDVPNYSVDPKTRNITPLR